MIKINIKVVDSAYKIMNDKKSVVSLVFFSNFNLWHIYINKHNYQVITNYKNLILLFYVKNINVLLFIF
jgi:hypothetical protein